MKKKLVYLPLISLMLTPDFIKATESRVFASLPEQTGAGENDKSICKILTLSQWELFQKNPAQVFEGSPDDLRDGFIHLSTVKKYDKTMKDFFKSEKKVVMVIINAQAFNENELKYENFNGGTNLYPHLYKSLPLSSVLYDNLLDNPYFKEMNTQQEDNTD